MNANNHARMSVCHHLPRLCRHKPSSPLLCRLGRSRQLPAPTLQPWPMCCLNSSCDMLLLHCTSHWKLVSEPDIFNCDSNLPVPNAYIISSACSLSVAVALSIAKVFCRSSKCYSVTARALKQDAAISDSSGIFFGATGARRAKAYWEDQNSSENV